VPRRSAEDRVRKALQDDVTAAKQRLDVSAAEFDEVIPDIPSGIPPSDGAPRIWNVSRAHLLARGDLMKAIRRINAFVVHGTIPEDLK